MNHKVAATLMALMLVIVSLAPGAPVGYAASVASGQDVGLTLDGVTLALHTAFLPGAGFAVAPVGSAMQVANAASFRPYREVSITAIPFGSTPGSEALPMARTGGAATYLAALRAYRLGQGAAVQPAPAIMLFGRYVSGQASVLRLHLDSMALKPTLILEWVTEAGQRLWIYRMSQEQGRADAALATSSPLVAMARLVRVTSATLDRPTTIWNVARPASAKHAGVTPADLPAPSWWNGDCDTNTYRAASGQNAYHLGAVYQGMVACGPRPDFGEGPDVAVRFFPGAWGVLEWECVELSLRYIYLNGYANPYGANGSQIVWNYPNSTMSKVGNGTANAAPTAGDVLSYGSTATAGHTSVVTGANVDGNGNGTVTVIEENAASSGTENLRVSGWTVSGGVTGWLHKPAPAPQPPILHGVAMRSDGGSGYFLDGYGALHPFGGAPAVSTGTWTWDIARGVVLCPGTDNDGYVLDGWGGVHPFGTAPAVNATGYWKGWDIARGIVLRPDCQSGYTLDGFGGLHPFASSGVSMPATPTTTAYWNGWDIARSIVLAGQIGGADSGYVLDGFGGLHPFGNAPAISNYAYWNGWDIARQIVLLNDGSNIMLPAACCSGYTLDGFGGVHPFGSAPAAVAPAYWPGKDVARGLAFSPSTGTGYYTDGFTGVFAFHASTPPLHAVALRKDGTSGYALDGYGNLTPFGGAPAVTTSGAWNWDIARSVALCPNKDNYGYTLDGWGGIHPVGAAPTVITTAYWSGWDIARQIVLRPDCQSGYVLDGFGAVHPFASAKVHMPPVPKVSGYWSNWDIAHSMVLVGAIKGVDSGYVMDGFGGLHPFGNAPAITDYAYWKGWDIARQIVLLTNVSSKKCCMGYTMDGFGGLHEFGGAPAISGSAYWTNQDIARGIALSFHTLNGSKPTGVYVNSAGGLATFHT